MEVRYTPGRGVLLARQARWLLLAPPPGDEVLEQLWLDLTRHGAKDHVLATLRRSAGDAPAGSRALAFLDAHTGQLHSTGGGSAERSGDRWSLAVAETAVGAGPGPAYRLVEGTVAADRVDITDLVVPDRAPAGPALIDGIPPELLAPADEVREPAPGDHEPILPAPDPGPVPPADHDGHTVLRGGDPRGDADHDGRTTLRPPTAGDDAGPGDGAGAGDGAVPEHLAGSTEQTVLAARCPAGHLTDAVAEFCRVCHQRVPDQEPVRVVRPVLGHLVLPDGSRVPLDRAVVFGRRPAGTGPGDWPHLVHLPQDSTYLSRLHLRIDLDGWHVLARDLGSSSGTTLLVPGRDPEQIRAHEAHVLEDGTTVDLAGVYPVRFEVVERGEP